MIHALSRSLALLAEALREFNPRMVKSSFALMFSGIASPLFLAVLMMISTYWVMAARSPSSLVMVI